MKIAPRLVTSITNSLTRQLSAQHRLQVREHCWNCTKAAESTKVETKRVESSWSFILIDLSFTFPFLFHEESSRNYERPGARRKRPLVGAQLGSNGCRTRRKSSPQMINIKNNWNGIMMQNNNKINCAKEFASPWSMQTCIDGNSNESNAHPTISLGFVAFGCPLSRELIETFWNFFFLSMLCFALLLLAAFRKHKNCFIFSRSFLIASLKTDHDVDLV